MESFEILCTYYTAVNHFRIYQGQCRRKSTVFIRKLHHVKALQKFWQCSCGSEQIYLPCTRTWDLNSCAVHCARQKERIPPERSTLKLTTQRVSFSANATIAFGNQQPSAQQLRRLMEDSDTITVWYVQRQVQSCKYSAQGEWRRARCF